MKLRKCAGYAGCTKCNTDVDHVAESTRICGFVEKAARGFVDIVVVVRQGFRRITRDEGCSFTEITGGVKGERNGVNRKESPGRKPCPTAFPSRRITIDSRTIVREEKKNYSGETN